MKTLLKGRAAVLLCLLVAVCLGTSGCGGDEVPESAAPSGTVEESEDGEESTTASTASGGSFWSDVPVYATAMQLQTAAWSIPPQDGDYEKAEWRYYELPSAHDVEMVARFYKMEMPKNGWQQMMEMEVQDVAMLLYAKNNEADAAYVWVGSEDGKTVFALMRASR